jgi:hypothetical protein
LLKRLVYTGFFVPIIFTPIHRTNHSHDDQHKEGTIEGGPFQSDKYIFKIFFLYFYTYPKRFAAVWATRPAKMAINELAKVALAKMRLMDCSPNWR